VEPRVSRNLVPRFLDLIRFFSTEDWSIGSSGGTTEDKVLSQLQGWLAGMCLLYIPLFTKLIAILS
jgi:hypothetical protein